VFSRVAIVNRGEAAMRLIHAVQGQEDVSRRTEQGDVVELRVELSLVRLAARHEQVAVLMAGQQGGDGVLAPDPVRRSVRLGDPVTPLASVGVHRAVTPLAEHGEDGGLAGAGHPGDQYLCHD
jgi:hypothetical protein